MNKSALPVLRMEIPLGLKFEPPASALALWDRSIQSKAAGPEIQIDVFGIIGEHVTEEGIKASLQAAGKAPVRILMNSPGGCAYQGIAIYHMVREYRGLVVMDVISLCASAASLIAMAADRIEMRQASQMMIHSSHGMCIGNQKDMRKVAEILDTMDQEVAQIYAARSGKSLAEVIAMMHKETYMTAEQAVANGFADVAVADKKKVKSAAELIFASTHPALLAASGDKVRPVVRLSIQSPGATGLNLNPKGNIMSNKSVAEQISQFEAKRQASAARMTDIMSAAADAGSTLDEAQTQEYDTLAGEVKSVDGHIVRLKAHEVQIIASAQPITPDVGIDPEKASAVRANSHIISVGPKLEKGIPFARYALSLARAHGNRTEALAQVQSNRRWMDQTPEVAKVLMAAVPAADTTTAGWASELAYAENMQNEFIEYLRPMTILGRLPAVRKVPFNIRMGSLTGGTTGYWVGQGKAIPMSKGTTGSLTLGIAKAAGMAAYDDELLKSSSPSIELLVRNDLAKAVSQVIDIAFIDPNNGGLPNEKPASVLYGLTPITPSGVNAAAVAVDVAAVFAAAIAANLDPTTGVWVMTPTTALKLSLMLTSLGGAQYPGISINGGTWNGLPVIVSQNAYVAGSPQFGQMIVLILQDEILVADDGGIDIQISNEASIEMLDNPTNLSTGATAPTTVVSMFQTQSWAIKCVKYLNFVKRRAAAAAFLQGVAYA